MTPPKRPQLLFDPTFPQRDCALQFGPAPEGAQFHLHAVAPFDLRDDLEDLMDDILNDVDDLVSVWMHAFRHDEVTNGHFSEPPTNWTRLSEEGEWRREQWKTLFTYALPGAYLVKVVATPSADNPLWCCEGKHVKEERRLAGFAVWRNYLEAMWNQNFMTIQENPVISEIAPRPSSLMRETHKDVAVSIVKMSDMVLNRRKDVWHLQQLAIHPHFQRQGLGAMLMQWGVERANIWGAAVYAEATPEGHRLYSNFGLKEEVVLNLPSGGRRIAMLKQPVQW